EVEVREIAAVVDDALRVRVREADARARTELERRLHRWRLYPPRRKRRLGVARVPSYVAVMPRQPRAEYVLAGGTYHVWSRGSNRGAIFLRTRDRVDFLSWLGKAAVRHEWRVLAYALLTNHYHLAVHIPEGGLSEGMKLLNGTFSRRQSR